MYSEVMAVGLVQLVFLSHSQLEENRKNLCLEIHRSREEWVSGKYFSFFLTKTYVEGTH